MLLKFVNGTKLGKAVMESRSFFSGPHWYWIGLGALAGFVVLYNIGYILCLTYLDREFCFFHLKRCLYSHHIHLKTIAAYEKKQAVLPEDDEEAENSEAPGSTQTDTSSPNEEPQRGMILPFEPHSITFDEVRYSVDMPAVCNEECFIETNSMVV